MLFRRPLGLLGFKDLAFRETPLTLKLKGEVYTVPIPMAAHNFDLSELTVIACPPDAPADVIVLPTFGNLTFKTMAHFADKKILRVVVPNLDPNEFKLRYGDDGS